MKTEKKLKNKISKTQQFIAESLLPRNDVNQELLTKYQHILENFKMEELNKFLESLRKIKYRPTPEGAPVDYTEGISIEFEGRYKDLTEFLTEIENLANDLLNQKL